MRPPRQCLSCHDDRMSRHFITHLIREDEKKKVRNVLHRKQLVQNYKHVSESEKAE